MAFIILQDGTPIKYGIAVDPKQVIALTETFYPTGEIWQTTVHMKGKRVFTVNKRMSEVIVLLSGSVSIQK